MAELPALSRTLVEPEELAVFALDELWSFVGSKASPAWIWLAQSRRTRQVVAYALGDRREVTGRKLWAAIPDRYRTGQCYTDCWEAYTGVIPAQHQTAAGKQTGATAHIERWNNTLRQRLARFMRKTLSFPKSWAMHDACLRLFLHRHSSSCFISLL